MKILVTGGAGFIGGTFVIYLAVGVVMIRMLLPWNFHFAMNVESHKILPFLKINRLLLQNT